MLGVSYRQVPTRSDVVDGSQVGTWQVLEALQTALPALHPLQNPGPHGFGRAIQCGLEALGATPWSFAWPTRSMPPRRGDLLEDA